MEGYIVKNRRNGSGGQISPTGGQDDLARIKGSNAAVSVWAIEGLILWIEIR